MTADLPMHHRAEILKADLFTHELDPIEPSKHFLDAGEPGRGLLVFTAPNQSSAFSAAVRPGSMRVCISGVPISRSDV